MNIEQLPDLATDKELQVYLGKSAVTLYRWRDAGLLPFHRIGGQIRYTRDDVKELLNRCRQNVATV